MSIDLLWQEFFSDPSKCWDKPCLRLQLKLGTSALQCWFSQKSASSPDFRRKRRKEVLWIQGWSNPPWVKAELDAMIESQAKHGDDSKVIIHVGAPIQERNGIARLNEAQLFVGGQAGARVRPTTIERRPREGVSQNSSSSSEDVRTPSKAGQLKEALRILNQGGIQADANTYICLLQECINRKCLAEGKQVHSHIVQSAFKPNIFLLNTLVRMYAKCGSMADARLVFDKMHERDMVTWNIMIGGYAKYGCGREAFKIFGQMQREEITPNKVTYICVLNACASLGVLEKGKEVHADIVRAGIVSDIILETALADMYAKCGSMTDAREVFDKMATRDVVSWNAIITGYVKHGCTRDAFEIYEQMQRKGVAPNRVTFICILNACASLGILEKGKEVHGAIEKAGIAPYIILENSLVDMYAKCGSMKDARQVFDKMVYRDVVTWSAMIAGYAQLGCGSEAFEVYEQMQREGVTPNNVTFVCILNACANVGALEKVKEVHADISKAGIVLDTILQSTLVDMYAKCGSVEDARQVFDNMDQRDVVSWNAMMTGYAQHGSGREAVKIYAQMQQEGITPDRVTFISVLNACASLGALEKGKEVHADIIRAGIASYVNLETALADMYAKCGSMEDAQQVFDKMAIRNVVSWSAMIAGYAQNGCGWEALQLFEQMQQEGLKPNSITFTSVLFACSHVGLVDEGCYYFDSMNQDYGLAPTVEHFCCMVDLLGRAGRLDEAEGFINKLPREPDAAVWRALLGACRVHSNVEVAERVAKSILKSNPQHVAAYVLLSDIYAAAGRWDDQAKVRKMMEDRGVRKEQGRSCIKVDN